MNYNFNCDSCGETIVTRYLRLGEKAKCKKCGAFVAVPQDMASNAGTGAIAREFICDSCGETIVTKYMKIGQKMKCKECGAYVIVRQDSTSGLSNDRFVHNDKSVEYVLAKGFFNELLCVRYITMTNKRLIIMSEGFYSILVKHMLKIPLAMVLMVITFFITRLVSYIHDSAERFLFIIIFIVMYSFFRQVFWNDIENYQNLSLKEKLSANTNYRYGSKTDYIYFKDKSDLHIEKLPWKINKLVIGDNSFRFNKKETLEMFEQAISNDLSNPEIATPH